MEKRRLMVNTDRCTGCGFCALVCAEHHCGQWDPVLGRIKPRSDKSRNLEAAITCAHCQEAPCVSACLMNVIYLDPDSQLVMRNLDACIGCRVCEISCPFGAGTFDYIRDKVVNCDLCGGRPVCVEYCPAEALELIIVDRATKNFQMKYHADRCTFCGQCVESCKTKSIIMSNKIWELASVDKESFLIKYQKEDNAKNS